MFRITLVNISYNGKALVENFIGYRNMATDATHSIKVSAEDAEAILDVAGIKHVSENSKVLTSELFTVTTVLIN